MFNALKWAILLVTGCIAGVCGAKVAEPFTVVDSFRQQLVTVSTFTASIDRVQQYRNVVRSSRGALLYDRHYGSVYNWSTPGKYQFFRSVFGACGVDLKKQTGWKTTFGSPDPVVAQKIDPFYRLTRFAEVSSDKLAYRGNSGDMLIFSMRIDVDRQLCLGFDAVTSRCLLTEVIDNKGAVSEKTKFIYNNKNGAGILPEAVVVTRSVGSELSVDSLHFHRIKINRTLKKELFAIPKNIAWNNKVQLTLFH